MTISRHNRIAQIIRRIRCIPGSLLAACLLALALGGCHQSPKQPITLTHLRGGWIQPKEQAALEALSNEFLRETGVGLRNFRGVPENTLDQLALTRKLLQEGGSGPDVLDVDVSWLGALQDDLIDLRPYFASEMSSMRPGFVSSFVVGSKLVAIPYQVHVGSLAYRADLLREYGYVHPPKTWDELERMAARIQAGERAKGKKDFWGYVWPGAAAESLTCNALEWQVDYGGGRIIESDATISVNNPAATRAWQRAKGWVGRISPPSVLEYREVDATNAFESGRAAFLRIWATEPAVLSTSSTEHLQIQPLAEKLSSGEAGYTTLPGGSVATVSTLGGLGLSVSKYSAHPREDATLIRFLLRTQSESWQNTTTPKSTQMVVYDLSPMLDPHNDGDSSRPAIVINRPSIVAANSYEQVSRAYFGAVHEVLTGKTSAPEAAAELEKKLVKITGFRTGPPRRNE
jgi:trehalose/maltose transport system substrate-binding protein